MVEEQERGEAGEAAPGAETFPAPAEDLQGAPTADDTAGVVPGLEPQEDDDDDDDEDEDE
jgi:hypothetical protein